MTMPTSPAAQGVPVANFHHVTVHLPGQPPIEIPGGQVRAVFAQPGLPTMVVWVDDDGREHQVMASQVHTVFAEPSKLYAPRLVG